MIQTTTNDFVAFINTRIENTIPKEYRESKHITWQKYEYFSVAASLRFMNVISRLYMHVNWDVINS